mgnify:CR=1 FL=1
MCLVTGLRFFEGFYRSVIIGFERQVLSGPTVLGKIELPVEKPKTPSTPASNAESADSKGNFDKGSINFLRIAPSAQRH